MNMYKTHVCIYLSFRIHYRHYANATENMTLQLIYICIYVCTIKNVGMKYLSYILQLVWNIFKFLAFWSLYDRNVEKNTCYLKVFTSGRVIFMLAAYPLYH